ncbi:MAG: acetyl-CoA C-acyltransferase [Deltaproteobacteria bacterium]|nr:acetyl-CoA C-acyltransferase [Deltaproteobacteria bacterium]
MNNLYRNGRRAAIVYGLRTPFIRSGTLLENLSSLDLGKRVTVELLNRSEVDPERIDEVIFGTVIPIVKRSNLSREIALGAGIPGNVPAYTLSSACLSSIRAITSAAEGIMIGNYDVVLAGGTESVSSMPILYTKRFRTIFRDYARTHNPIKKVKQLLKLRIQDFIPNAREIAELYTGISMANYAEKIAKENHISRNDQDAFSLRSHKLAFQATEDGRLRREVMSLLVPPNFSSVVSFDNGIRKDLRMDDLSRLKPIYDKIYGTVTEGNSSPLSDGASVVLMMSEEKAKAMGYDPLGYIRSFAYSAQSPKDQILMGPVYSTPIALERAGLSLHDIDLIEMHEACASQVLSNLNAFASKKFAEDNLGKSEPIGEIDLDKLNVLGGSIAIGHPFSSTGSRLTITLLNELKRRDGKFGMVTTCAAGALGATMILERE